MIDLYVLHPFNFMIGFAWHREECQVELFLGLFAVTYCWDDGLC
jgi:hypothetical protein